MAACVRPSGTDTRAIVMVGGDGGGRLVVGHTIGGGTGSDSRIQAASEGSSPERDRGIPRSDAKAVVVRAGRLWIGLLIVGLTVTLIETMGTPQLRWPLFTLVAWGGLCLCWYWCLVAQRAPIALLVGVAVATALLAIPASVPSDGIFDVATRWLHVAAATIARTSRMHSWATRPWLPV